MNPLRLLTAILCISVSSHAFAEVQDIDKELSDLTERLAVPIKDHGKTKVAVIDFTDLEGSSEGELGKYIAEQLTVDFVMTKRDFSVLDRANLNKILAEHKLTSKGLVDPENAKQLGKFAGVDALILGTIIPKGTNTVSLNAKIITTDTAEIIGASRAEFKVDTTVQQLTSKPAKAEAPVVESQQESSLPSTPQGKLGELQAKVLSVKLAPIEPNQGGQAMLTMVIANTSETKTYGVAVSANIFDNANFNLSNDRGEEFERRSLSGISSMKDFGGRYEGSPTEIPPRSSITITSKFQLQWTGKPGDYRPYHLQTVLLYSEEDRGQYPNIKSCNLVLDVK
jgi:curli biogenesis system outer membrane secretion channel CsgG